MIDKIQTQLNSKVKWLFHYLGFMIERIPDETKLYSELDSTHEAVQKHILKRLTDNIRVANNHRFYNNILKRYVPEWDVGQITASFVGNGIGEFSFNTFRKVYIKGGCYFEKVYFNNTYDLLRIEWFHEHINPMLHEAINVAKICQIIKGDLITIVYFEFTELIPLPSFELEPVSFIISKKLINLSRTKRVKDLARSAPSYLKEYRHHAYYRGNIKLAGKLIGELSGSRLSPDMIEQVVGFQPLVLTHGDIQETNVFANNYLIDWDSFGFLPLGFESAYILYQCDFRSRKNEKQLSLAEINKLLDDNYKTIVEESQWLGFELTCLYFYFVFNAINESAFPSQILQGEIFPRIEQLYETLNRRYQ